MKKNLLLILCITLIQIPTWTWAQNTCFGDITLNTQADVNAFDCTIVKGNLTISGDNIVDLEGLSELSRIEGSLIITGNPKLGEGMLYNFDPWLMNLTEVGKDFVFENNPNIMELGGFSQLSTIGRNYQVKDNAQLLSLAVLNLKSIGDTITVKNNPRLTDCCILKAFLGVQATGSIISNNGTGCESPTIIRQSCGRYVACTGENNLNTQAEVDTFNCSHILSGTLSVSGSDITNLDALSSLVHLKGRIDILQNPKLSSIEGLRNLKTIVSEKALWDGMYIRENPEITSTEGLRGLIRAVGPSPTLGIEYNDKITSIKGLRNMDSFFDNVLITHNNALTTLEGLENLTAGSYLSFDNNDTLTSLKGLENLEEAFSLRIDDNELLTSLAGLEKLSFVESAFSLFRTSLTDLTPLGEIQVESMFITYNNRLKSLKGLEKVTFKRIEITDNNDLKSLMGLNPALSGAIIEATDNPELSMCCNLERLSINNTISIRDNAPECNDLQDVRENCTPPTQPAKHIRAVAGSTTANIRWRNGNGTHRIVVMKKIGTPNYFPEVGRTYTASPIFGLANTTVEGNSIVANGTVDHVNVVDLKRNTPYQVRVFEYSEDAFPVYNLTNFNTLIFRTLNSYSTEISPNPLVDDSRLVLGGDMDGEKTVFITDVYNRPVKEIRFSGNELVLHRSDFNEGMYLIKVYLKDQFVDNVRFIVR